jgi:transposase
MNALDFIDVALPVEVESIQFGSCQLCLRLVTTSPTACCPLCGRQSHRIHSRYQRRLQDLPWGEFAVRLEFRCRKFFCDNPDCQRAIFAEPLRGTAPRYARRTRRLQEALHWLGLFLSGEAAARLSRQLCCAVSGDTILRHLHRNGSREFIVPQVLGVDDFAFRRGQRYGTLLLDLERHQVVDLLPDREAETLAAWLRAHLGVKIISRDRAGAYADGARRGAPEAVQVADRWHLLKNAVETLEKQLWREQPALKQALKQAAQSSGTSPSVPVTDVSQRAVTISPTPASEVSSQRRMRRQERYHAVRDLAGQGYSIHAISRELGIERKTIRRFLRAGEEYPERATPQRSAPQLGPFQDYLRQRWQEQELPSARCGVQLFEEIRALGYRGCLSSVTHYLHRLRVASGTAPVTNRGPTKDTSQRKPFSPSPRAVAWLLVKPAETLEAEEREYVQRLRAASPSTETARNLVLGFFDLIRNRNTQALEPWMQAAQECGLVPLRNFAAGLRRDLAAITAALTLEWSNGQTEGQINRLKFIKRSMYGRASFDLLRAKVLAGG